MSKTICCDVCQKEVARKDRVIVALPRPSDPSELCAVLWTCSFECASAKESSFGAKGAVGTSKYIGSFFKDDQVDETFQKYGYVFLSI